MHIVQLTYSTKPRGGVVHTLALSEELARRGHDVELWTLGRGGDTAFFRRVDPRVRVRIVPFEAAEDESVGDRIDRSIEALATAFNSDAEIVHAQDCISFNAVAAAGVPAIRTIHHLDAFTTPRLIDCHDRAVAEPMARVSVSAAVAAEVHDVYGVTPTVIPNGVDAVRFARAAAAEGATARDAWQSRLGRYVLALGGIEPRKGTADLLEAVALLRRRHPDVKLVIGGGETLFDYRDYRAAFDARARAVGIEPVVLGSLAEDDLPSLVAAASALGFASVKEGFGLAAMEALAAGVPVVARNLPVTREVFGDAVAYAQDIAGFADALERVFTASHPAPPERGRRLAARHTWAAAAERHERLYTAVLRQGGDHGSAVDLDDPR